MIARTAKVIGVTGVNPGAGKSVIALNLAFEMAANGSRVCLVDLDSSWPSLHRYLAVGSQQAAVLAACRFLQLEKLDANSLEGLAVRLVAKGASINFLSGYGLDANIGAIGSEDISQLLTFLADRFDALVIDAGSASRSAIYAAVMAATDSNVVVTQPDSVSLARYLEHAPQITSEAESTLVVNRFRASVLGARPEWQLQQMLRQSTAHSGAAVIPQDDAFDAAVLQAVPLRQVTAKSMALRAMGELAASLL